MNTANDYFDMLIDEEKPICSAIADHALHPGDGAKKEKTRSIYNITKETHGMKKTVPFVSLTFLSVLLLFIVGCTPTSTPEASQVPKMMIDNEPHTLAEVEAMSGLDISEPAYLPEGVSFDFATYQQSPVPSVTSQFKLVHEQYGEMGRFFQIVQEAQNEAPADTVSCGEDVDGCEMLQVGNVQVIYHLYSSGAEGVATEGLDWYSNGFSYRLLRTAGEPNKLYKDELIKVVESME